MTMAQVRAELQISNGALYRLMNSGQLPWIKLGASRRVLRSDLDAMLVAARNTGPTAA